jgi:hypothetical protein
MKSSTAVKRKLSWEFVLVAPRATSSPSYFIATRHFGVRVVFVSLEMWQVASRREETIRSPCRLS